MAVSCRRLLISLQYSFSALPSGPGSSALRRAGRASASCGAGRAAPRRRPRPAAGGGGGRRSAPRSSARRSSSSSSWAWMTSWRGFVPRSCDERRVGDPPAVVLGADELVVGHEHVGEEHLVELGLAGELHAAAGPRRPAACMSTTKHGDAPVLRARRGRCGPGRGPSRRTGRSDVHTFWPLSTPAAVDRRRRACVTDGEVAAGVGLAEQLAPQLVGARGCAGSQRAFCSAVPWASSVGPTRLTPMRPTSSGARARASSSCTM